jgi:hypothetical protein
MSSRNQLTTRGGSGTRNPSLVLTVEPRTRHAPCAAIEVDQCLLRLDQFLGAHACCEEDSEHQAILAAQQFINARQEHARLVLGQHEALAARRAGTEDRFQVDARGGVGVNHAPPCRVREHAAHEAQQCLADGPGVAACLEHIDNVGCPRGLHLKRAEPRAQRPAATCTS